MKLKAIFVKSEMARKKKNLIRKEKKRALKEHAQTSFVSNEKKNENPFNNPFSNLL